MSPADGYNGTMLGRLAPLVCLTAFVAALCVGCVEQKRIDHGYHFSTGGLAPATFQTAPSSLAGYQPMGMHYGPDMGGFKPIKSQAASPFAGGPKPPTFGQPQLVPGNLKPF